jgi:hypothetical protein
MLTEQCENSDMGKWLKKNYINAKDFQKKVGCSRPIILKVKKGIPISPLYAKRIFDLTKGEVNPVSQPVGRPW